MPLNSNEYPVDEDQQCMKNTLPNLFSYRAFNKTGGEGMNISIVAYARRAYPVYIL